MKKSFIVGTSSLLLLSLPLLARAQPPSDIEDFVDIILRTISNVLVPLIIGIAFIVFIWGVFRYFIYDTEEAKERGKDLMVYGLIGFVVIISIWGLVNLLVNTFDLDVDPSFNIPEVLQNPG